MSKIAKRVYEDVAHLFYERGMERGLGRPLTADEALEDPIIAPLLEKAVDMILGESVPS